MSETDGPSDPEDRRVGKKLGERYTVYRVVADGGMARVYEALDQATDRQVALKVLHPELLRDGTSVARFKREYSAGIRLRHPNIVEVVDFLETGDGSYALVMEYLVGQELRGVLKREGSIGPARVVRMLSQLALGLEFAHDQSFIHRDLKPDNIFLCQSQEGDLAKILDFGSVKNTETREQLTVMGTMIGSPYYMSPEQAQGLETVDHRTDIWALATIAYESLLGRVPFAGNNGPAVLFQILSMEPPPPSSTGGSQGRTPPALDPVFASALTKDPQGRTKSASEFVNALGHAFGLTGDYQRWAQTPQASLDLELTMQTPELQSPAARVSPAPSTLSELGPGFGVGALLEPDELDDVVDFRGGLGLSRGLLALFCIGIGLGVCLYWAL